MPEDNSLLVMTSDIVQHYLQANKFAAADLPSLIQAVHGTLRNVGDDAAPEITVTKASTQQIRKSVTPDALISFIDQRPYKTLKRHIERNGLTVQGYRDTFGLPADYPMTAPAYSARRCEMAKAAGLGAGGRQPPKKKATKTS